MLVPCSSKASIFLFAVSICLACSLGLSSALAEKPASGKKQTDCEKWISLFDGKTLNGWKKTSFGTEADVVVEDGTMII